MSRGFHDRSHTRTRCLDESDHRLVDFRQLFWSRPRRCSPYESARDAPSSFAAQAGTRMLRRPGRTWHHHPRPRIQRRTRWRHRRRPRSTFKTRYFKMLTRFKSGSHRTDAQSWCATAKKRTWRPPALQGGGPTGRTVERAVTESPELSFGGRGVENGAVQAGGRRCRNRVRNREILRLFADLITIEMHVY